VRAVSGKVFDVAVDLRNDSATFGEYFGVVLDAEKQNQFYIPKGFAHGFLVLTDSAIFAYKCTDFYDPTGEGGIPWNDRTISVNWNSGGNADFSPVISEKDKHHALFSPQKKYFDMDGNFCFQEGTCAD
jgi:dTDP-4-dehydrorhamnose 3,5-epimerase